MPRRTQHPHTGIRQQRTSQQFLQTLRELLLRNYTEKAGCSGAAAPQGFRGRQSHSDAASLHLPALLPFLLTRAAYSSLEQPDHLPSLNLRGRGARQSKCLVPQPQGETLSQPHRSADPAPAPPILPHGSTIPVDTAPPAPD